MLFGFAFNTKHFGQQFCLGLSIISPKHILFTIGDNKSPPPCSKTGEGNECPLSAFQNLLFYTLRRKLSLLVFDYCACPSLCNCCNFNPRAILLVKFSPQQDLRSENAEWFVSKKNISWRAAINSSKVWLEWPWWGTWWSVDRN